MCTVGAVDRRGHALRKEAAVLGQLRVDEPVVGVAVHVDEAGRHNQAGDVDRLGGPCVYEVAYRRNAPIADRHVGHTRRAPRAVDDGAAHQEQVEVGLRSAGEKEEESSERTQSSHGRA